MMIRAADPMEKSSSSAIMLFDDNDFNNNAFCNDDLADFLIDMGELDAILGEESAPPPPSQAANVEGFQHGEVTPSQFDPKQKSYAESTTDLENSQWNFVALDPQQETQFGFHYESEGNLNDTTGGGGAHASTHFDSNYVCPMAAQYSSNGLVLPCPSNNYSANAFGGSSGSFFPGNFDQLQFQTNMQECGVPGGSINSTGLISFPVTADNGLYFNSEKMDSGNHEHKPSFQIEYEESNSNGNCYCSISKGQNGETGSSLVFPLKNCNFTCAMHSSVKLSSFPDSTVEDGNMYPLSTYLYKDSNARVPDRVKPETNTFEASNVTCDGSNGCLTLPTDSNSNAEFGFPQIVSAQFQQGVPYNSEKLDGRDYQLFQYQNSCWISDVKLHAKEESPDSSLADASISDLDSPLLDELCTGYSHSDDASLISESSADSSPITSSRNSTSDHVDMVAANASQCLVSGSDATSPTNAKSSFKDEREDQLLQPGNTQRDFLKGGSVPVQKNPSRSGISVEDDPDICILDDISDPVCPPRASLHAKPHLMSQRPEFSDPRYHGIGGMRFRPDDERLTFRLALKDLSQPKSEVSPPDGVLAVPLLRHQRIALSWMVKKETVSLHCSGGILADDQGLGKTVSTIALILLERSPSTISAAVKKEDEYEALNLDDDDDAEVSVMKQPCKSIPMMMDKPMKKEISSMVARGRPAAGTLVVCPTSVLRQWAEELQTKVTSKANLSFLVYHGSNRTKDPNELAKYDVVLTTYAIVSMEVPKQPLVDKDDEEKGKHDTSSFSSGLLNSKKRKDPTTSNMKNQKGTSTMDGALLESAARPLGRVGWFRVILDEAQSIKNYRTQVARACWGLRAKRRWCLSGTPIQNAVDDLYSYFRFLRYDPYAVYKSFCSTIKTPISRNPTNGYKKLQAVLKTIMLRRTKGTIIDGKPIITLPPKTITLKKVEFSTEERAFYSKLEAVSREQFMEYEDAGTVKQNYVNILLMLLRLRQACDHPLLVKGGDSNLNKRSSMEMANKLSREKRIILLSRLEISLAICTICNDPPEDAVVTICGHVFCNQCVCEHLTADENICPSPNCKVPLRASSVFSKSTLKSSLSDELADDCCSGSSCFEMGDEQKFEDNWSSGSSKIKAAIEILCSLPRFQCSLESDIEKSDGESSNSSVNTPNSVSMRSPMDSSGKEHVSSKSTPKREVSEKAIVFSQWTGMLDLLEVPLKASCIKYRRLDGTMSVAAREKAIKDFKSFPEVTVIILSLKAASLGLNLVAANHVILLDLWWNPTTEDQAIDRAHRIGQTRPVTVSRLTVKDTVEDKILSLQEKKRVMVASAFGEDESGSRQSRLTVEDLRYLFMA